MPLFFDAGRFPVAFFEGAMGTRIFFISCSIPETAIVIEKVLIIFRSGCLCDFFNASVYAFFDHC